MKRTILDGLFVKPALLMLSVCTQLHASSMLEPYRKSMDIRYKNGDRLQVICLDNSEVCRLHLLVNGIKFEFEAAQLQLAMPEPVYGYLYSGTNSGRDKYFSFRVSAVCIEEGKAEAIYDCEAQALVVDHKLRNVNVIRRTGDS